MENDQPGNYVCRFCKGCFTQSQLLLKHVQQVHAASPSTRNSRTCPICGTVFGKYEGYRTHLRHIHGQRNEGQIFAFKCFNDFFLWKTELEKRSLCKYSLQSAPKVLPTNERIHVYQCDRSVLTSKRKKSTWTSNETCPAMVCATESMKNREIKVEYWNTHVGHSVPVEDDELNAAINSVQSEEPSMHVMEMLNSIGQGIETGAEVFVTETVEEEVSSSPSPRNQKNIFNIKKASAVPLPKKTPIVQNFSFKKDPSKKKESSIYSLASVACGKVSANKVGLNKSIEKNPTILLQTVANKVLDKTAKEDSVSKDNKVTTASASGENNADNSNDKTSPSNVKETSVGGQLIAINPLPSVNKQEIVYNWPVGKPLPTDWVFSPDMVSSEKKSSKESGEKLLTGKENVSSVSNKIVVPLEPIARPSDKSTSLLKNSKVSKSKKSQPTGAPLSALNSTSLGQNLVLGTSGTVVPNMSQFVLSSVPVSQHDLNFSSSASTSSYSTVSPRYTSIAKSSNSVTQFSSILPAAQTYISVNNKLIPVMNPSGSVFPTNLGSSVLLPPTLAQSPTGKFPHTSLPTSTPMMTPPGLSSYHPLTGGAVSQTTSTLGGTISPLTTFPSSPVIIIPCTSVPSTVLQSKPTSTISSPLILQSTRPMTSVPVRSTRAKSIVSTSLVPSIPKSFVRAPVTQQTISRSVTGVAKTISGAALINNGKLVSSTAGNLVSTTLSNAVKVQKVSLPGTKSSQCAASLDNMSSANSVSQQNQVNSVVLNTSPISSTPTINIPGMTGSSVQNAGTFVFESSGELYMLEPLDDDGVAKNGTPLTSTPKKTLPAFPKTPTHFTPQLPCKRKRRSPKIPKSPAIVPSKTKELEISPQTVSAASTLSAKVTDTVSTSGSTSSVKTTTAAVDTVNNKVPFLAECNSMSSSEGDSESSVNIKTSIKDVSAADIKTAKCAKDNTATSISKTEMTITIAPSKTPGEKEVSFISKTSPFDAKTKISVTSSPVKPTSSLLTVKTVPSFSIPQSRPVTSFLSSVRTPLPSLTTLSTSNYISSHTTQTKTPVTEFTSPFSDDRDATSHCNTEVLEAETSAPVQNSEVKRGVTIKSVAQEKRCVSDDDLEVMKKVKFYKLEMKYFACQEQCKKLKIELAKALSKNRELTQMFDEKGKNEKLEKESSDLKKEPTVAKIVDENQKVTASIDENKEQSEDSSTVSPKESTGEEIHRIGEQGDTAAVEKDDLQVETEDFNLNELGNEMVVEDNEMALKEQKDITAVTSEVLNDLQDMDVAAEIEETSSSTGFQQELMDIEHDEKYLSTPKDEVIDLAKPDETSTKKDLEETKINSDADVYTMVRTSVLRSLYCSIEDLSEEKKQLQNNLEKYKRHHSKFVPLFNK